MQKKKIDIGMEVRMIWQCSWRIKNGKLDTPPFVDFQKVPAQQSNQLIKRQAEMEEDICGGMDGKQLTEN